MYCNNCKQHVRYRRQIGVGTLILVIMTSGLWILAIFFYNARCPLCGGSYVAQMLQMPKLAPMPVVMPPVINDGVIDCNVDVVGSILTQQSSPGMPSWLYWLYGAVFFSCVGVMWLFC